ncbi:uncharacterized protein LOC129310538 [Prosopis cineraria]|uniref:uncharacterized protein LOC129310538 n=1 Tax=Prosopis cineraria TaxID=364024 RepID=UPI00240F38A0|nr:uncharacterized protein LOC129310538 [Prosopis cineraria]
MQKLVMEEATLPSNSSLPLVSRLDHLEFIIKYLERKQRGGSNAYAEKQSVPLDFTAKQSYYKDTLLLDRVASLEQRLFQLCMEMDSSSSSYLMSLASTQTSGESSSSQSTKTEIFYSFPTFTIPHDRDSSHTHLNTLDPLQNIRVQQEKTRREKQHEMKNESAAKQKEEKRKSKGGKKRSVPPSTWLHFKLLGC